MPDDACSPESVSAAIETFKGGEERGFDLLVRCFYRRIESFFARARVDATDRRDLTQETFLRVYRGLSKFRGDASFKTWLFRIAHNLVIETRRRQSSQPRLVAESTLMNDPHDHRRLEDLRPDLAEPAVGLDAVLDGEQSRQLREAIEALPDQMRQCLILRIYHDLKYREVAAVMKLSIETVKAHLYQARKKLELTMSEGARGEVGS